MFLRRIVCVCACSAFPLETKPTYVCLEHVNNGVGVGVGVAVAVAVATGTDNFLRINFFCRGFCCFVFTLLDMNPEEKQANGIRNVVSAFKHIVFGKVGG